MAWITDLLQGWAADMASHGIGTWNPAGYTGTVSKPIYVGAIPPEVDEAIGINWYSPVDDAVLADVLAPVQLWFRGPRGAGEGPVNATADAVFDLYHGTSRLTLGGIAVALLVRNSAIPHGTDPLDRAERSDNYYPTAMRPTASRPD